MKTITQERIIKTLNKISAACSRATDSDRQVILNAASLGIRAATGVSIPRTEFDRLELEFQFHDFKVSPDAIDELFDRVARNVDKYAAKRSRVFEIRVKYDISSLVPTVTKIGDKEIHHLWGHDDLIFIPSDLPKLAESKVNLAIAWIDYTILNKLNIYVNKERWEKCDHYEVNTALPFYQWAKIWGSEERGMHLCLGNGLYSDDPDNQMWFVAHNKKPSY